MLNDIWKGIKDTKMDIASLMQASVPQELEEIWSILLEYLELYYERINALIFRNGIPLSKLGQYDILHLTIFPILV